MERIANMRYKKMSDTESVQCNCNYYELNEAEQAQLDAAIEEGRNQDTIALELKIVKDDHTETGHFLGCPIDVVHVCSESGNFYMNSDTLSARTVLTYASKGLLKEGPVNEERLTDSQKERREVADQTLNARLIGLYRR